VREVAAQTHLTPAGEPRAVSVRSVYRWLAELDRDEPADPEPADPEPAPPARAISRALPTALLDFLAEEKAEDRYASVPELLRRAHQLGVIGPHQRVDRTSVWRACVRLGLPLRRAPAKQEADRRRFAYPHRMMMVLADGKHFRAGVRRRRRVALFFLDDASRFGLGVVVGTDETAALFLRGLHAVIRRFGFMDIVFLDRGPGFRADDTAAACHRLDIHLVLGTAAYPEGHGKIRCKVRPRGFCLRSSSSPRLCLSHTDLQRALSQGVQRNNARVRLAARFALGGDFDVSVDFRPRAACTWAPCAPWPCSALALQRLGLAHLGLGRVLALRSALRVSARRDCFEEGERKPELLN
jgi:hypothetical protein